MGYDMNRFRSAIDEELICCICKEVLQDPVQAAECEHAFCIECIRGWLNEHQTCPVDRTALTESDLKPPSRILRNIHKKLVIACDNEEFGCSINVRLELLQSHLNDCAYSPQRPVPCDRGCGVEVPLDEMPDHNCVHDLRQSVLPIIVELRTKVESLEVEIERLREEARQTTPIITDNQAAGSSGGAVPFPGPSGAGRDGALSNPHNLSDEEIRWCQSLDEARVRRWGGMISTPDNVLQGHIRRSLQDSGCPARLLNELITYSHERKWPNGLNSLEMRQVNRVCYEQYVTRRVPGRQAVVVLFLENQHMDSSFITNPGLVLIFAHGID